MSSTSTRPRSASRGSRPWTGLAPKEVLTEEVFRRMISLERKRSERTQRPFVLLLMDTGRTRPTEENGRILLDILHRWRWRRIRDSANTLLETL